MSDHAHSEASHGDHDHHDWEAHELRYKKIWGVLLVLLVISVLGPTLEILWITLITAFGIAFVKAYLVAKEFMHVNAEKPVVWYALITALVFMVLFFFGTAPDVMNHEGTRWENVAAKEEIARAQAAAASDPHGHGHDDHGEAGDAQHGDAGHKAKPDDHGKEDHGGDGH